MTRDYATRIFASAFFFLAIAGLLYLLLIYSGQMTEVLKGIVLILLGNLGPQAGVAWGRLADPDKSEMADLRKQIVAIQAQLVTNEAAHLARDEEQRRMISDLLDRMDKSDPQKLITGP